ncbi:MAG: hypothetical protein H5T69_04140 [Chloroflexi bacterium]|nr:hypothetical protein [Chloroflexota bacterium]
MKTAVTLDEHLDNLADELDELAQTIRNRKNMAPGNQAWEYMRQELLRAAAEIWRALADMTGEEQRWPQRN